MKIKNLLLLCALPATLGILSSCEKMDENYKQYTDQDVYSGKITNLNSKIGYQSVILYWDNPTDQQSKGIEIVCMGSDTISYKYDFATLTPDNEDLVIYKSDSIRIKNLTEGTAYDFTVYSTDSYGNRSIAVSKSVLPLSEEAFNLMIPPIALGAVDGDGNTAVNFMNITSLSYNFAGTINYEVFDGETKVAEGEATGAGKAKNLVAACSGLKPDKSYTVKFITDVLPLSGTTVTEDTVKLSAESKISLKLGAISGLDYTIGENWVKIKWTQAKNELSKKIKITSSALTTPLEIADSKTSEGGEQQFTLTENKAVKFSFVRVDENGTESEVKSIDVTPATKAQVETIDYPQFSISKDILGYMTLNADKFGDNSKFKTKGNADGKTELTFKIVNDADGTVEFEDVIKFPEGDRTFALSLPTLKSDGTYTVTYSFECYPKVNNKTSEDVFTIARTGKIENGAYKAQ